MAKHHSAAHHRTQAKKALERGDKQGYQRHMDEAKKAAGKKVGKGK